MIRGRGLPDRARGMTLIEVLITCGLLVILSGCLMSMLVGTKTMWQSSSTRISNGEDLHKALWKMLLELHDSDLASVTNNTSGPSGTPVAFSFMSAYDSNNTYQTNASGAPNYQKYVIYYIQSGSSTLYRREVSITGTTTAAPLTTDVLTADCDGSGTPLSTVVTSMTLTTTSSTGLATLAMTVGSTSTGGYQDTQSETLSVQMRN